MGDVSYQRGDGSRSSQPVSESFPLPVNVAESDVLDDILEALSSENPVKVLESHSWVFVTSKTTTVVKATPGTLVAVIQTKAGSTDTVSIYNAASATGTPVVLTSMPVFTRVELNMAMDVAITIVTGGTTAGEYLFIYE